MGGYGMDIILPYFVKAIAGLMIGLQWIPSTLLHWEIHTINIKPSKKYQTLESFGTSAAWWAQHIESEEMADDIARALYCKETGLGLDVIRYNVGGGDYEDPNSYVAGGHWQLRRTQSFYIKNPDTGEFEYDFTRDANARRVLDKAIAYGATQVVLFCNSPHFSMTISGHATGGLKTEVSNLAAEKYPAFVEYLLAIADWFVAQGYPVTAISPVNEPQWGWGGDWVGQEGCHYKPEEVVALMELFAVTMKQRGSPYALLGPESGDMSDAHTAYTDAYFQSEILNAFCDTFAGHSYWMDHDIQKKRKSGRRFKKLYPGKKFEMSEWCELPQKLDSHTIDSGLYKANIIVQDLTLLNAVSWQSWVAVNEDGVMDMRDENGAFDLKNGELVYYNRYWAFKQFTSFIKPGAVRVKVRDSFWLGSRIASVAFKQPGETVLVMVNNSGKAQSIRLGGNYSSVKIYTTDAGRNCELTYKGALKTRQVLPARSISTYILAD